MKKTLITSVLFLYMGFMQAQTLKSDCPCEKFDIPPRCKTYCDSRKIKFTDTYQELKIKGLDKTSINIILEKRASLPKNYDYDLNTIVPDWQEQIKNAEKNNVHKKPD